MIRGVRAAVFLTSKRAHLGTVPGTPPSSGSKTVSYAAAA